MYLSNKGGFKNLNNVGSEYTYNMKDPFYLNQRKHLLWNVLWFGVLLGKAKDYGFHNVCLGIILYHTCIDYTSFQKLCLI